jgi:hypothetical protein
MLVIFYIFSPFVHVKVRKKILNFTYARCRDVGKKYKVRERGAPKNIVFGQLYTPLSRSRNFYKLEPTRQKNRPTPPHCKPATINVYENRAEHFLNFNSFKDRNEV